MRFWGGKRETTLVKAGRVPNSNLPGGQVYIVPLKSQHFSTPQTERDGEHDGETDFLLGTGFQQRYNLLRREGLSFIMVTLGNVHKVSRVTGKQLMLYGIAEGLMKVIVDIANRCTGQSLLRKSKIQRLNILGLQAI